MEETVLEPAGALHGLLAGASAGTVPHSDAAGQDALNGTSVESVHDSGRSSCNFSGENSSAVDVI